LRKSRPLGADAERDRRDKPGDSKGQYGGLEGLGPGGGSQIAEAVESDAAEPENDRPGRK
jgi:hypothetical protein